MCGQGVNAGSPARGATGLKSVTATAGRSARAGTSAVTGRSCLFSQLLHAQVVQRKTPDIRVLIDDLAGGRARAVAGVGFDANQYRGVAGLAAYQVAGLDAQQQPTVTTVAVDQRTGGGQYRLLGEFTFDTVASITLTDAADGYVIADGIRVEPLEAAPNEATWTVSAEDTAEYYLDLRWTAHPNRASDARYTIRRDGVADVVYTANQRQGNGSWTTAASLNLSAGETVTVSLSDRANGYVIADAVRLVRTDAAHNRLTWPLDIQVAGEYRLEAQWTSHPNRASNATYVVHTTLGPQLVTVNQRQGGGGWQPLGTFSLDETSEVVITDEADGFVVADGIRIVWAETSGNEQILNGSRSQIVYFHNDHLGTPQVITDQEQQVVWQGDYLPFGEVTPVVAAVKNPIRFPGQYYDEETGLHYNYFRGYDPAVGRYLQSDPLGLMADPNTYLYVWSNPLLFFDPLGLFGRGSGQMGRRLPNQTRSRYYTFEKCQFDMAVLNTFAVAGGVGLISGGYKLASQVLGTAGSAVFALGNSAYCTRFPAKDEVEKCNKE